MAVISLRLNRSEENMVNFLSDYYEQDRSSLIKYSLKELYEDITDRQIITDYEAKEKNGRITFVNSDDILTMINGKKRITTA